MALADNMAGHMHAERAPVRLENMLRLGACIVLLAILFLIIVMPLYALRWCAIILGELLPERWQHRMQSNPEMGSWDQVRREQINKARTLISRIAPCTAG